MQDKLYGQIGELLKRHGVRRLAVESDYMTLAEYARWKERLPDIELFSDARAGEALRALRAVKSPRELAAIRAAQKITDDAFTHICGYIKAGMTDRHLEDFVFGGCRLIVALMHEAEEQFPDELRGSLEP